MPDTSTPAQDLADGDDPFGALPYPQLFAAINAVEAMARRTSFNAGDSVIEDFHSCLSVLRKKVVKVQQAMEWASVRGACGTSPHASFLAGWEAALRSASVGSEIAWPTPDSGEVADSPAGGGTAPKAEGVGERPSGEPPISGTEPGWYRTMGRDWAAYHYGFPTAPEVLRHTAADGSVWKIADGSGEWWDLVEYGPGDPGRTMSTFSLARSAPGPKPTAREKILAEVEAMAVDFVPGWYSAGQVRDRAVGLAKTTDNDGGRANLINAAALLVLAVEHLDGAR